MVCSASPRSSRGHLSFSARPNIMCAQASPKDTGVSQADAIRGLVSANLRGSCSQHAIRYDSGESGYILHLGRSLRSATRSSTCVKRPCYRMAVSCRIDAQPQDTYVGHPRSGRYPECANWRALSRAVRDTTRSVAPPSRSSRSPPCPMGRRRGG
jgi:hypothetical protein